MRVPCARMRAFVVGALVGWGWLVKAHTFSVDERRFADNTCLAGEWECASGDCIDSVRVCDGNADCPEEEDEDAVIADCREPACSHVRASCMAGSVG
jgi:hypothetical protein